LVQWQSEPVGLRDWILDLLEWERICWDGQRSEGNNNTKSKTQPLTHKPNKKHNWFCIQSKFETNAFIIFFHFSINAVRQLSSHHYSDVSQNATTHENKLRSLLMDSHSMRSKTWSKKSWTIMNNHFN
jgi:hypothetical protein